MLTCPNCQEQIEPVNGGFTPHFDQATQTFSCTKHPNVINPLSGERDDQITDDKSASSKNESLGAGIVTPE